MSIEAINIDGMPCDSFDRIARERARGPARLSREGRFVGVRYGDTRSVGFKPESLYDWRGLERRWRQLAAIHSKWHDLYWGALKGLGEQSQEAGHGGEVLIPDRHVNNGVDQYLDEYHLRGNSLGSRRFSDIVKRGIGQPDYKPFVVSGDALKKVHRLKERSNTWQRRMWAYAGAFRVAVNERIESFVRQQKPKSRWEEEHNYRTPYVFTFDVDDRSYFIVTDNRGVLTWYDGVVFADVG